ncbi:MAG: hypothetical protein OXG78_10210, partial [Chloroflexi bacterium]|nr:hypothetical protein [Chloroflexota bacterium]
DVYGLVTHHETMAGFILLFALSLFMLPRIKGIRLPDVFSRPLNIGRWARLPYMICLVLQCAYLPILWAHHSDNPVFFGRFSLTYIVAVIVNLAIIIALLLAIWRYRQFEDFLRLEQRRLTLYMMTILVCALIFLAAPELRNMHYKVVGVLFLSAFSFFVLAWWQLALLSHDPVIGRLSLLALIWSASSLATAAIIVSITLFMAGKIWSPRFLASVAFLFTASGLVWGFAIGTMHKRRNPPDGKISILVSRLSALAFIVIYSGIVLGQIASFPHFTAFAREWQARDTLLREAAVSGQLHVEIPPTAFDLEAFLKRGEIVDDAGLDEWREGTLLNYYGLESITLIGEG